ncbi:MAG: flagellar biosynthesis protein FlgH [Desulfobulbaceae bacterium A2]|nr:MAG: flagellar biosynthesis protein FlgH [Desulfobulbaceae bacterium A2]
MKLKYLVIPLLLGELLLGAGCASHEPKVVTRPPDDMLEQPDIEEPRSQSSGSLWTGDQQGLFADHKAARVGDIVTVTISEKASASKEASTDSGRTSSMSAAIPALFGLEKKIVEKNPSVDMSNLVSADFSNSFKGSGKTLRKEDLVATLTTQVIKVYPNGNLKIRGGKSVVVNNEEQLIYLTGIVRPQNISGNNIVDSKYVLNAQIAYTGEGSVSDKQKPGWLMRTLDTVWPF